MIDFQNVSFSYGEESRGGGIRNINLTIKTGEFVLLTGESGCGKTTITRLVNGLVPHYYEGNLEGNVFLDGKSVSDTPLYDLAAMVGSVFQNPKSQFFNVDTDSELAFACENLGYPQEDILKRIGRTVSDYHIENLMGRSVFALSGGEKQKIACASSSVLLPGIMVLDEPSSNLDMAAIDDLRQVLSLWKKQGKTILIAEHRLYYLHDLVDRVLYVKDGEIEQEYTPAEFDSLSDSTRKEMGLRPFSLSKLKPANQYQAHTTKQMEFQNFCFAYKKQEPESLHIPSAELPIGETIAIIGLNGAGKSTLARCVCGLEKKCGVLQVDGKALDWKARLKHCYMVMQDTSHQLFTESVTDEILLSMDDEDETVVEQILEQFDLLEYKDRHPLSLSGGQKQRVAIASAIVSNREIIVFDEPTSGLDLKHMREVARSLKSLADQGKTILVITHDPELVMAGCSYVVHMEKGQIKESYEPIIPRDLYMQVQEEMIRRANLHSGANRKKRVYSSKYALSSIVYCSKCGEIYRRIAWNNRGKHSTVWRCCTRVEYGPTACDAPTIQESDLQTAVVQAINLTLGSRENMMVTLQENVEAVIRQEDETSSEGIETKLQELQKELLKLANSKKDYNSVADEIDRLRELKQNALVESAEREGLKQRIREMREFLEQQSTEVTEYDELLVRRLIEKITVYDERFEVEFKSGAKVDVE